MKKAIVLGATGGVGNPITAELVKRGVETVAFGRSMGKLKQLAKELGNHRNHSDINETGRNSIKLLKTK